jgi:hypothetical protein
MKGEFAQSGKLIGMLVIVGALAACEHMPPPEPVIVTSEAKVPVATPCKPDLGPEPVYPDTRQALTSAPDLFERVKLLLAGRELRIAWTAAQAKALKACGQTGGDK